MTQASAYFPPPPESLQHSKLRFAVRRAEGRSAPERIVDQSGRFARFVLVHCAGISPGLVTPYNSSILVIPDAAQHEQP